MPKPKKIRNNRNGYKKKGGEMDWLTEINGGDVNYDLESMMGLEEIIKRDDDAQNLKDQ